MDPRLTQPPERVGAPATVYQQQQQPHSGFGGGNRDVLRRELIATVSLIGFSGAFPASPGLVAVATLLPSPRARGSFCWR